MHASDGVSRSRIFETHAITCHKGPEAPVEASCCDESHTVPATVPLEAGSMMPSVVFRAHML